MIALNKKTLVIALAAVLVLAGIVCAVLLGGHTTLPASEPVAPASAAPGSAAESAEAPVLPTCNITLNGGSVSIDGPGAKATGSTVTITQNGDYYLSGTLDDGQILVDAAKEDDDVRLHLCGVDLKYSQGAVIHVVKAGKVYIELEADTENFIADTENYVFAEGEDEPDAAIFAKDDLIFDGEGTLTVSGSYALAIHGKDDVKFRGTGTYNIRSAGDGVKGKDSVEINDATLNIDAGEDGIQANNDKEENQGRIEIGNQAKITITAGKNGLKAESHLSVMGGTVSVDAQEDGIHSTYSVQIDDGNITINSQEDGVQAGSTLDISGGTLDIVTDGGAENAPEHTEAFGFPGWFDTETTEDTVSAKGLKSDGDITISGGSIHIDAMDDAVHCVRNLTVKDDADLTVATGDDGFHSDENLSIEGGKINITKSYEGLEGVFITISGGDTTLVASDDGLNAAGGTTADTDFAFMGPPGMEGQAETLEEATYYVHITGGKLSVDAGGDGLDSNGALFIDGGEIYVSGPDGSMNGGLDYTTTGQVSGGTVVVAEISSMAQNFDSSSTQVSFRYGFSTTIEAGTAVTLKDKSGKTLVETTMAKQFNSVTISTPELTVGETYTLTCGSETVEVELTEAISSLGNAGFGFGGPGGPGGGPGGFGGPPPM